MIAVEANPLLEGLQVKRRPEPCVMVIFGASGDLTQRKLMPALYALAYRRLLPRQFGIVGVARSEMSTRQWTTAMKKAVQEHARDDFNDDVWESLRAGMRYVPTDFADDAGEDAVIEELAKLDETRGTNGNRVLYLAVPPMAFEVIVEKVGKRRDRKADSWIRLIVEKPFGYDRESSHELNRKVWRFFDESEIFRIDHYLGKETVQNMLALRFANGIFEPIWNRQF